MAEVESARPMGKEKVIIFIDELPWFDTAKSGFLRALDLFWNGWASNRREIKLVVCGSATTWMTNKLLGDRGGIHTSSIQGMLSADDLFTCPPCLIHLLADHHIPRPYYDNHLVADNQFPTKYHPDLAKICRKLIF